MDIPKEIYIWGGGLIGYTLAQAFADHQRKVTVLDVDHALIENIRAGKLPRTELSELMESPSSYHKQFIGGCHIGDFKAQDGPSIHFLSVPTEKNGETLYDPIKNAIFNIVTQSKKDYPVYLIAESTISPNWFSTMHKTFADHGWIHGKNYHIGASPRRDVFNSNNLRMQHISKIIGGDSPEIIDLMKELYSNIAGDIHIARDAKHAMLVKIVENFLRDSTLNIVNGLTSAFPEYDMVDVFELASTKWNIEKYHPSLGIGGYCIPLAKKYMADAADGMDKLEKLIPFCEKGQYLIDALETVIRNNATKSVAILGLSYGPSFKVHTHSPTFEVVNTLKKVVEKIVIHDPFYTGKEIKNLTGCDALEDIEELHEYDAVILVTPHPYYYTKKDAILKILEKSPVLFIDNLGAFRDFVTENVDYWEVGSRIPDREKSQDVG
jgi:nucleotide sugar dehydrogenase